MFQSPTQFLLYYIQLPKDEIFLKKRKLLANYLYTL